MTLVFRFVRADSLGTGRLILDFNNVDGGLWKGRAGDRRLRYSIFVITNFPASSPWPPSAPLACLGAYLAGRFPFADRLAVETGAPALRERG
jgi:hypothetical protein